MNENNKLPHLSYVSRKGGWRGWALNFTRPYDRGPATSANIERGLELTGLTNKSELIDRAIEAYAGELEAQKRIELALRFLADEMECSIYELPPFARDMLKALTGCATDSQIRFVSESQEYREFVKSNSS